MRYRYYAARGGSLLLPWIFLGMLLLVPLSLPAAGGGIVVDAAPDRGDDKPREGDILLSWAWKEGGEGPHPIPHVFEFERIEEEVSARGTVFLRGRRNGEDVTFALREADWGFSVRPRIEEPEATWVLEARDSDSPEVRLEAAAKLADRAGRPAKEDPPLLGPWLLLQAARAYAGSKSLDLALKTLGAARVAAGSNAWHVLSTIWDEEGTLLLENKRPADAESAFQRALDLVPPDDESPLWRAMVYTDLGRAAWVQRKYDACLDYNLQALDIEARCVPGCLRISRTLFHLAMAAWRERRLPEAEEYVLRSVEAAQEADPGGIYLARRLNTLGNIVHDRGRLGEAEDIHRRALAIRRKVSPGGLGEAFSLGNLGNLLQDRGDYAGAEVLLQQSIGLLEKNGAEPLDIASLWNNLGIVAQYRGNLVDAEHAYEKALAIREEHASGELPVARSLHNLGNIAEARGDAKRAREYYERALALKLQLAPGSLTLSHTLSNLGLLAERAGDASGAEERYREALRIKEKHAPESLESSSALYNIANLMVSSGRTEEARPVIERALAIAEGIAPESLEAAGGHSILGACLQEEGKVDEAESHLRRCLEIRRKIVPETTAVAVALYDLALLLNDAGGREEALRLLEDAVNVLESQEGRLGGSTGQIESFRARHHKIFRTYVRLLMEAGRGGEAFHVLERSRAQVLLSMLTERDLDFAKDISPELARERRLLQGDRGRLLEQLSEEDDAEEKARIAKDLRSLGIRREELKGRIRAASPRLASLRYPEPLSLAGVQEMVKPGALVLAWSLGSEAGHLFAVGPEKGEFGVYPLAVTEKKLRSDVARLRGLLSDPGVTPPGPLKFHLRRLSEMLLGPAANPMSRAERLVLLPEGPLFLVPFAALPHPAGGDGRPLAASLPLSVSASATLLAEIRGQGAAKGSRLTAFGDPSYEGKEKSAILRALARAHEGPFALDPLPGTRAEVAALGRLFPRGAALYLGGEATEERASSPGKDTRILHFACHGFADERHPLDSFLALALPGKETAGGDDGLLQAWEIFEEMRLDADLVTLSACETALGKEVAGEGIVGLTRAFQYAGARSVLASLWRISDEATARLMTAFYGHIKEGAAKDEALRLAQCELMEDDATAHPFYWAAFVLTGDGR